MWLSVLRMVGRFQRDIKGAIAIIFAASLFLIVLLIGMSVDYVRWQSNHSEAKSTLDAAVLAAGRIYQLPDTTDEDAIEAAYRYFDANRPKSLITDEETVNFSKQGLSFIGTVTAGRTKTPFLSLFGYESLPVTITSTATLEVSDLELSLMLDITGSMGEGSKLEDLKEASKNLINIVLNDEKFENTSKIALVPFSTFVNVGETYFERVTGTTVPNGNDYTCVAERDTTDRYTDASPDVDNYFSHLKDYYPDIDDVCPTQSTIVPLTNDKTVLETNIDSFSIFRSSTAGHLATAFAWYTLSPRWKHIWFPDEHEDEDNTDVITTSDVRRITVLMTDGRYNAQYSGDPSKDQALRLCENIKNEGIVVYAVGFDIPKGSSADEVMLECASSEGHYYNAANGEELKAAYYDIAMKMFLLRVSK